MANEYVTVAELKQQLNLQNEEYFNDELALACEAGSRMIDNYKGTRFYSEDAVRFYTGAAGRRWLEIDDLLSVDSVTVDLDGDGDYETTWTAGTEFFVDPVNALVNGQPGGSISLHRNTRRFPAYARAIRVEGSFGWGVTPPEVKAAAKLLAHRLLKRWRETPYAILTVAAAEAVALAKLGTIDPDVELLLADIPGTTRSSLKVVQLG